jgi:beta-galactosidase
MPSALPTLAFGGDYNPEQWPRSVWEDDVRLMREAGVNLVTVGVFSWALLERSPGTFTFDWLDDVVDLLHAHDVKVDLATATASPPAWLARAHPEMLPVRADGTVLWPGGRQGFCPSSPVYREHALRLCRAMAERYGDHDALALWHVGNELGSHNALCYCDVSAEAFRGWLAARYGDVDRLNDAWGTAFWSQHYESFDQVLPPRVAPAFPNPTQQLDFRRFSSDQLLANFVAERDVLRELSPGVTVTTNFLVMPTVREMD